MKRIYAPQLPYRTNMNSLHKQGNNGVIEIPISAFLYPYIGTTLRVFPRLTRLTRVILNLENKLNGKPINFLTHPNEFIEEDGRHETQRRTKGVVNYLLKDWLRQRLKLKNLGKAAIPLYEREIKYFMGRNYRLETLKTYAEETIGYNHPISSV